MKTDKAKQLSVRSVVATSLRRQWRPLLGLAAIVALATLLESAPALVLRRLVDDALGGPLSKQIWLLAAAYLGALVAQRVVSFGQDFLTTVIGQGILHELRLSLTAHLRALGLAFYDSTPVGEIMSRSTADVEAVNTLFTAGVISMVADALKLVGVLGPMFALNTRLAWVTLATLPIMLVITEAFRRNIRTAQRRTRQAVGRINSTFQESLSGIKVIRAYGQEETFRQMLADDLRQFLSAANRASLFNSYFTPVVDLIRAALTATLIVVGARLLGHGSGLAISIGTLVAFITQMVPRLFTPLTNLSDELQTIQEALAGAERIDEVLLRPAEQRPELQPLPARTPGQLAVTDLVFGYGERPILRDINLVVPAGQRLAIVGRTGAGKTSLLSVLAGIYAPWSGSVTIDGVDPRRIVPADRRRLLGVVPQTIHLIDGTIRDNITLGDVSIADAAVRRAAAVAGLADVIEALPQRYDTPLGAGGASLSHGEEQLLSLARALVLDPAVLLLDEPTSGLDADTEQRLFAAIRTVSNERTTITISHRLSGVLSADRVIVMSGGRIVQDGTPERLAAQDGWYAMMQALESLGWQSEGAAKA